MAWLAALVAALGGYFVLILIVLRLRLRAGRSGKRRVLVLLVHNISHTAEAVLWDLIRLESWRNGDFDYAFIDLGSTDDTFSVLKILQRQYGFDLYQVLPGQVSGIRQRLAGKNIIFLKVNGPEPVRVTRRRIVNALNDSKTTLAGEMPGS